MSKLPAFQFYPGDWMKDPALSMCGPATRGIWIDLLCAMHELDRCGEIAGTPEQLARLCRCSVSELQAALTELSTTRAAEIAWTDNTTVVVQNRRMRGEYRERRSAAERQQKSRFGKSSHGRVTANESQSGQYVAHSVADLSRNGHSDVTFPSSSSHPLRGGKNAPAREGGGAAFSLKPENKSPPPLEAVVAEVRGYVDGFRSTGKQPTGWKTAFGAAVATVFSPGVRALSGMDDSEFLIAIQNAYEQALAENKVSKTA